MIDIKILQHDDFLNNKDSLNKLLSLSYESNFNITKYLCDIIVDSKIKELELYLKNQKAILIGVLHNNTLVGFVWCHVHDYFGEKRIHVNQIIVEEDYRGKGIAKELLKQVEIYASQLNIKTIDLFVTERNNTAVDMYENLGFVTERRYLKKNI